MGIFFRTLGGNGLGDEMAIGLNRVMIIGRLGQDPKISYTQSGNCVVNLSVATDESYKDSSGQKVERTEWHRIVVFGQAAEFCANYLAKGRLVFVEGRIQTRKWQDQNGQDRYTTEIVAARVLSLEKNENKNAHQPHKQPRKPSAKKQQSEHYDEDHGPAFPSEAGGMDQVPF
jgi:single-strand DNA-binding protein